MNQRILLVEDESAIADIVLYNLRDEGYVVEHVDAGIPAVERVKQASFDLILLDIMLPDISGFDVYETIRLHRDQIPVIFITARDAQSDINQGLKLGARDYITKPFDLEELLLRVQNACRGSDSQNISGGEGTIDLYDFRFDFEALRLDRDGARINLKPKEAQLLKYLLDHIDQVIPREELIQKVWGYQYYPNTRTIDNHIVQLRKYLEPNPKQPQRLQSVRSVGYRFQSPDH